MTEWEEAYKTVKGELEEHDVSAGIAMAMSVKDEDEQVSPPQGMIDERNLSRVLARRVLLYSPSSSRRKWAISLKRNEKSLI
jgi:hypothetical protein